MARDYKHRAQPRQQNKATPGWVWLLAGLLVGAFATSLYWLQADSGDAGGEWIGAPPDRPPKREAGKPPPKAETPARPKPRFDFYTLLPEMEVVVPEDELDQEVPAAAAGGTQGEPADGRYLIQVGSFRSAPDAERLKAQLALLGIESRVIPARINERETRFRVRSGPYSGRAALDRARTRLADNGYKGMVIRSR